MIFRNIAVDNLSVRFEERPAGTLISEGFTNSSGVYTDATFNFVSDTNVDVVLRQKGLKSQRIPAVITSVGLPIQAVMNRDPGTRLP